MFHFVYVTTNKINGKRYIGKHSTANLEDDYFGSGVELTEAVNKIGKRNFTRRIIKNFATEKEAYQFELRLIRRVKAYERDDFYNRAGVAKPKKGPLVKKIKIKDNCTEKGCLELLNFAMYISGVHELYKAYDENELEVIKYCFSNVNPNEKKESVVSISVSKFIKLSNITELTRASVRAFLDNISRKSISYYGLNCRGNLTLLGIRHVITSISFNLSNADSFVKICIKRDDEIKDFDTWSYLMKVFGINQQLCFDF